MTNDICLVFFNEIIVTFTCKMLLVNGKHCPEIGKLSDSFIYGRQQHYNTGWLYIFIT